MKRIISLAALVLLVACANGAMAWLDNMESYTSGVLGEPPWEADSFDTFTGPGWGYDGGYTAAGPGQLYWTHGTAWRAADDPYNLTASMMLHPDTTYSYQHAKVGFTQAKNIHADTKEFHNDYFIAIDYYATTGGSTGLYVTLEYWSGGVRYDYSRTPFITDVLTWGTWYDFKLEMTATMATAWYKEKGGADPWNSIGTLTGVWTDPATWANYVAMSSYRGGFVDDVGNGVVPEPGSLAGLLLGGIGVVSGMIRRRR